MSYIKLTDFDVKDSLLPGNPNKVIKGSEIDDEFDAISSASVASDARITTAEADIVVLETAETQNVKLTGAQIVDAKVFTNSTTTTVPASGNDLVNKTYADTKAPIASPTLTGTPAAPTAAPGTNTTQIATTAFVSAAAFSASLPSQTGNGGKFITTDGTTASWALPIPDQTGNNGEFLTTDGSVASWSQVYPTQTSNANKSLFTNGTSTSWLFDPAWQIKTANYTAVAGERIQADTNAVGAWTLTLPATPAAGDRVVVADYAGTFATNNLTIGRNGNKIMGLSENMTVSTNNVSITLEYIDATQGWRLV